VRVGFRDLVLAREAAVGAVMEEEKEERTVLVLAAVCDLVDLAVGVEERLAVAEEGRCA
jgi:hypothetical protein